MQQEKAKTTKAPVVKEPMPTALPAVMTDDPWKDEEIDTTDLLIGKILLMHPSSDLVKKREKAIGEFINSIDKTTLAKHDQDLKVIVFAKWKEWRILEKNPKNNRFDIYKRLEAWTPENDKLPWDFTEDGKTMRRDKTLNFYCLLADEAEAGMSFPLKLSFTRTSYNAGKVVANGYTRASILKGRPIDQIYEIGRELKEGKEESFYAFTAKPGIKTTEKQRAEANMWKTRVNSSKEANTIMDHEVDEEPVTVKTSETKDF